MDRNRRPLPGCIGRGGVSGFSLTRVVSAVTQPVRQVLRQVAEPVEDLAERVERQGQRSLDLAQEITERVTQGLQELVGAEGLSFRDLADQMNLPQGVGQVVNATDPWIAKLEAQILAARAALAEIESAGQLGQVPAAPSDIPAAETFQSGGIIQSPMGQLVIQGVGFAGPIGGLVATGLNIVGAIGGTFGKEKTRDRFIQIRRRLDTVFAVHGDRVDRAVDILAILGDPDALAVKGEKQRQVAAAKPGRRVAIVAGTAAAAGAGILLIRSFLGRISFSVPNISRFRTLAQRVRAAIPEPTPRIPTARGAPAGSPGTRSADLRVPGALNPADNLGLAEISRLVNTSNRLHAKTVELVGLLDRLGVDVGTARPGVSGLSGPLDVGGRLVGGVVLTLAAAWVLQRIVRG